MACVVGPTDAGMAKMDKGNLRKVYEVWSQRIEKELMVNVSTDREFRVAKKPSIMAEKVNNWDPREQKLPDLNDGINFEYPPIAEINDPKFLGIEAFPKERFDAPQSEYHKIGWMVTPNEYRTEFAQQALNELKMDRTCFTTGTHNKRDLYWRTEKRKKRNPMAHHMGYITGLGDNPYEKTIKDVSKLPLSDELTFEWKRMKKKMRKDRKKRSLSTTELLGRAGRPIPVTVDEALQQAADMRSELQGSALSKSGLSQSATALSQGGGGAASSANGKKAALKRPPSQVMSQSSAKSAEESSAVSDSSFGAATTEPYVPSIVSSANSDFDLYRYQEALFAAKTERCKKNLAIHAARLNSIDAARRARNNYDDV